MKVVNDMAQQIIPEKENHVIPNALKKQMCKTFNSDWNVPSLNNDIVQAVFMRYLDFSDVSTRVSYYSAGVFNETII